MNRTMIRIALACFSFFAATSVFAQEKRLPIFQKGSLGTMTSVRKSADVKLMVGVNYAIYKNGTRMEYQMVALVRGQFAVGRSAADGFSMPYVDLDIVPLAWGIEIYEYPFMFRALPIRYQRNKSLNQSTNFQISAAGIEYLQDPRGIPDAPESGVFYGIALDALTLKLIKHHDAQDDFKGFGFPYVQGKYGHYWGAEDARVRVMIGGNAGMSWGGTQGHGAVFQTDASVYAKASLDWKKFMEFYFQTGLNSSAEFGAGARRAEWLTLIGVGYYL